MECWRTEHSGRVGYSGLHVVNRFEHATRFFQLISTTRKGNPMNSIVYIVGLVVIILFILGFFGLR